MKPKPFDFQAFRFHEVTKKEAVDLLREEAKAGQSLSPEAMLVLADIFDPNVDQRGRSFKKANFRLWETSGFIYALWKHKILKIPERGVSWINVVGKVLAVSPATVKKEMFS